MMSMEAYHSQSAAKGLREPSDTRLIDTDYRYTEAREKKGGKGGRERERQIEVVFVGETLSGCKWNNKSMNLLRNQ